MSIAGRKPTRALRRATGVSGAQRLELLASLTPNPMLPAVLDRGNRLSSRGLHDSLGAQRLERATASTMAGLPVPAATSAADKPSLPFADAAIPAASRNRFTAIASPRRMAS